MTDRATLARRRALQAAIRQQGGAYIAAADNRQPADIPALYSITLAGVTGIGLSEAAAQRDWTRQRASAALLRAVAP